jgi:hypothetical protein
MRIKYKETYIEVNQGGFTIGVYYPKTEFEKDKFYFHYLTEDNNNPVSINTSKVKQLAFKGGMVLNSTPEKMKVTMEDLKERFNNFDELGGGNIKQFLSYLQACDRDNKLNELGI